MFTKEIQRDIWQYILVQITYKIIQYKQKLYKPIQR